jgi:hypothetical protein
MDTAEGDQEDPISLHKYLYCRANPVNGSDPSGHQDDMEELGDEESSSSLDALPNLASIQMILGTGGPDVTQILNRTLNDVSTNFAKHWTPDQRQQAESRIGGLCAGNAWEIVQLHNVQPPVMNNLSMGKNNYKCGSGQYEGTVAVNKNCYYADAVNYALFGRAFRLCHDDFMSQQQWLTAADYSLAGAKTRARLYKATFYGDFGEHVREALAFVEYGYNGRLSSGGLPCTSSGLVTEPLFDWKWLPVKP